MMTLLAVAAAAQQVSVLARQVALNIYAGLQPAPGMAEWAKILISASVGALLGIGSSILMEFVKPSIAKRQLKKLIKAHLIPEATLSVRSIEGCMRVFSEVNDVDKSGHYAMDFARITINGRSGEMYDHFLKEERVATYVIERAFREVRRRTRPMSTFSNLESCDRIIYGVVSHLNSSWERKPIPEFTQYT